MPRFRPFPGPTANQRLSGFFFSLFNQTAVSYYGRRCYLSMMGCQGGGVDFSLLLYTTVSGIYQSVLLWSASLY